EQVPGHRPAHVTQSYKANFHVVASLLLSGGWACFARRSQRGRCSYTPLWGPARGGKGCSRGRALHAVRSGGAAPTPLCGSPARGRAVPGGVLCTPFAARALLLHTAVGAPPSGRMARSARPLSCA